MTWDPRDSVIAHGVTVRTADEIALIAARSVRTRWVDPAEAVAIGRAAVLTALITAGEPPGRGRLVGSAMDAVRIEARKVQSMYGCGEPGSTEPGTASVASAPRFTAYWLDWLGARTHGHEDAIVDRFALAQILPRLRPSYRQALLAVAETGSYTAAADLLGIEYHNLLIRVSRGRREFLALWHEHEEPSRPWGTDRRIGKDGQHRTSTSSATLRGAVRRRQQARAGKEARRLARMNA